MILGSATSHRQQDFPKITVQLVASSPVPNPVDICSNGTNWVVVGYTTPGVPTTVVSAISSDLVSWTQHTVGLTINGEGRPTSISANSTGYFITMSGGTNLQPTSRCYFSPDGVNWTLKSIGSGHWFSSTATSTHLIGVSISPFGTGKIAYSTDGTGWASTALPGNTSGDWEDIATNGTNYTLISPNSFAAQTARSSSLSGPWTVGALPDDGNPIPSFWTSITANISKFVATAATSFSPPYAATTPSSPNPAANSPDNGSTWSFTNIRNNYLDVTSNGYIFLAVGQFSNVTTGIYAVSEDGINWVEYITGPRSKVISGKGLSYDYTGRIFGGIEIDGTGITRVIIN